MGLTLMCILLEEAFGSDLEMSYGTEVGEETGCLFLLSCVEKITWRDCVMCPLLVSSLGGHYLEALV